MIETKAMGHVLMKNRKLIFMGFSLMCLVAIMVCLIVNIAIDQ